MPDIMPGTEAYAGQHRAWNEIQSLSREEFERMAPSVIRLESARISNLVDRCEPGSEAHTILVAARYRLRTFAEALTGGAAPETLSGPLEAVILSLALGAETHPESAALLNLADRLDYVLAQIHRMH